MSQLIKDAQKRLLTAFVAIFSMFSIAAAQFEPNPQSCGMINSWVSKRKGTLAGGFGNLPSHS
ncbi:hypothetical protein IDJ77_05295 [Mucilaginibacter sp. ZT4R22]|uniref:Uncharacterized protein n=1 Tax=Mucilaginibacter pankratovii TaxID=2772110 RepID=A0ABR7WLL5_9SPHI|nr:hypothetical protein [Mucilaginibacter pankratovii]MBD1363221.1 hypothetical protein [Mucilaginibacter pankratovii]